MMKLYTKKLSGVPVIGGLLLLALSFQACKKNNTETPAAAPVSNIADTDGDFAGLNPDTVSTLSRGLIAYWPLAGNANDLSGNGNRGVAHGTAPVTDRSGNAGGALSFSGRSYINIKDTTGIQLSNKDFSLNAWVSIPSFKGKNSDDILSAKSTANTGWRWYITGNEGVGEGKLAGLIAFSNGRDNYKSKTPLGVGDGFHMVTTTYRLSTQTLKIYIDGTLDKTITHVLTPDSLLSQVYIGRQDPGLDRGGDYFVGAMSDIRVYSRVITRFEIQYLHNVQTAPTTGLVGYWPLNRAAKADDISGIDYSAISPRYNVGSIYHLSAGTDRFGNKVGAYSFNGKGSAINFNNGAIDIAGSEDPSVRTTLNIWVKLTDYNNAPIIYFGGLGLYIDNNGKMNFYYNDFNIGTHIVSLHQWHMITIVYVGGGSGNLPGQASFKFYLDGVQDIYTQGVFDPTTSSEHDISTLGSYSLPGTNSLHGALNDFRVYNRQLSDIEIRQLFFALN